MDCYFLGRAPYREVWALQERLRQRVLDGGPETLLLVEHPPVLSLGRFAAATDILADEETLRVHGVEQVRTSRGGKVTYHGPGQLVAYPVVRLRHGVVAHVEWLATAAIEVASSLGVAASYSRQRVGVWVGERKLAAIGVEVSRRVSIHGLALNVSRQSTAPFGCGWFVPCGEATGQAVSLEELSPVPPSSTAPQLLTVEALALPLAWALCRGAGLPPPQLVATTSALLSDSAFVK
jgi:lipoyl(octanoyl) transferase